MARPLLAMLREIMTAETMCGAMPFMLRSAALRTRATLLMSQCGAVIFRLDREQQKFPLRTFRILTNPDEATAIGDTSACRFDTWTENSSHIGKRMVALAVQIVERSCGPLPF